MDIYLRQHWNDARLSYNGTASQQEGNKRLTISARLIQEIWTPDASFPTEKHADFHDVTVPNKMMKVSPNGDVLYSMR